MTTHITTKKITNEKTVKKGRRTRRKNEKRNKKYGFHAYVKFISDTIYKGFKISELSKIIKNYKFDFIFMVDSITIENKENPILCIDLTRRKKNSFRVISKEMWTVENNLTISNMDFHEFYKSTDKDGVFRGFE